jgi:replication initiation protein RepC
MTSTGFTAPFGRRAVSLGHLVAARQFDEALAERRSNSGGNHPTAVDKWRLFRTLTAVRERLGLSDRSLGLLQALLSFHPETALTLPAPYPDDELDGDPGALPSPSADLVVFPSNRQLALRANGMAEKTIRRHLAALVDAGLILRRDSANGKRYARRAEDGADRFSEAFGFDLTPLVLRTGEFEALEEGLKREARRRAVLKERITVKRRDIAKLIALADEQGFPGDWMVLRQRFLGLVQPLRRILEMDALETVADALACLFLDVQALCDAALSVAPETKNMTGNDGIFDRHISISNTDITHDFEPAFNKQGGEVEVSQETNAHAGNVSDNKTVRSSHNEIWSPGLIREACPDMVDYAENGELSSWPQIIAAARVIRPMLGISPDAWTDAVGVLGEDNAAAAVGLILQRSEYSSEAETREGPDGKLLTAVNGSPAIRSPGGYLRALTDKARAGEFSLGPVLMATIGQRLKGKRVGVS